MPATKQLSAMPKKHPPLCIECIHHKQYANLHKCDAFVNLITGEPQQVDCATVRVKGGRCDIEGKLFESKTH